MTISNVYKYISKIPELFFIFILGLVRLKTRVSMCGQGSCALQTQVSLNRELVAAAVTYS